MPFWNLQFTHNVNPGSKAIFSSWLHWGLRWHERINENPGVKSYIPDTDFTTLAPVMGCVRAAHSPRNGDDSMAEPFCALAQVTKVMSGKINK